jgi:hypothetical protein
VGLQQALGLVVPTLPNQVLQNPILPVHQEPVLQVPVLQGPVLQVPVHQVPVFQVPVFQVPVFQVPVFQVPVFQVPVLRRLAEIGHRFRQIQGIQVANHLVHLADLAVVAQVFLGGKPYGRFR